MPTGRRRSSSTVSFPIENLASISGTRSTRECQYDIMGSNGEEKRPKKRVVPRGAFDGFSGAIDAEFETPGENGERRVREEWQDESFEEATTGSET